MTYFNGQDLIDVLWRTIIFDIEESNDDVTLTSPASQTFKRAFTAWWIWACFKWLKYHKDEKGAWASVATIHFLCQFFDPETKITPPTNDFKKAIRHHLFTQTTIKDGRKVFNKYYQELLPFSEE